ncbi:YjiH family protein [Peptoniphilus sp. HMSC062D09]|uniref:YjiH family protein n=1 Tax=Peptoniphilus sp. HMSC062D09 TaxID=1739305 RepID=UPI0008A37089|nr:YjiH family protein [Peptoniphilus sp. HMSC062D09]OFK79365.1 histidine transporter [Peptoniphilus sp. HMSC062D09]
MEKKKFNSTDIALFIFYSLFGIFMFFVPITIGGAKSIPIDHITTLVKKLPNYNLIFGVFMVLAGIAYAIKTKSWQKSKLHSVFFAIKLVALVFVFMYVTNKGPARIFDGDMLPLIWNSIMVSVATIVPIGSVFLAFLTGFGLMEFIGVFMEPVMRPVFKTPGRSAVDAVASFVGSYSLALLITNRVYLEDTYTKKEAAIIATGFSTVSATFMIIVAKTLDLLDYWLAYFWITLFVTFIVTAITARIFPLNKKPQEYYSGKEYIPEEKKKVTFGEALDAGMETYKNSGSLAVVIKDNFIDGFKMALNIAPSLLGVGMIGLLLAEYTPIFDIIGYIFYPFTLITRVEEPLMVAQALGMSIAEMLLPAPVVANAGLGLIAKMLVAVVSVSEILFFSASIPVMMGTEIPLKFSDYIIIWIERVILSIVITMPILYLFFR